MLMPVPAFTSIVLPVARAVISLTSVLWVTIELALMLMLPFALITPVWISTAPAAAFSRMFALLPVAVTPRTFSSVASVMTMLPVALFSTMLPVPANVVRSSWLSAGEVVVVVPSSLTLSTFRLTSFTVTPLASSR